MNSFISSSYSDILKETQQQCFRHPKKADEGSPSLLRNLLYVGEKSPLPNPLSEIRTLIGRCVTTPRKTSPKHVQQSPLWGEISGSRKDCLKPPFEKGIPLYPEGANTCPVDGDTCEGFPDCPTQSELNLRDSVASQVRNTQHQRELLTSCTRCA